MPSGGYYVLLDTAADTSGNLAVQKHTYLSIWPETPRDHYIDKRNEEPIQFFCDSKQQAPEKKPLDCRIRLTNIEGKNYSHISMYGLYMEDAEFNRHLTIGQPNSERNRKLIFSKYKSGKNKFELLPLLRRQHNDGEGISAVMRSEDGKYICLAPGGCLIADADTFLQAAHLIFMPR